MRQLDIGIKVTGDNLTQVLECSNELRKRVGVPESSGCGFGVRDIQWNAKNKQDYDEMLDIVRNVVKEYGLELDYP